MIFLFFNSEIAFPISLLRPIISLLLYFARSGLKVYYITMKLYIFVKLLKLRKIDFKRFQSLQVVADTVQWSDDDFGDANSGADGNDINLDDLNLDDED